MTENDPYDPSRGPTPPPPPPSQPEGWGQSQPPSYGQPYGAQPYGQPQYGAPTGSPPSNNLVWAILSTLFCCLPLGIVSIVFAAQVNSKWTAGDVAGAMEASKKAKNFAIWSAVVGVVGIAIYLIVVVAAVGSGIA